MKWIKNNSVILSLIFVVGISIFTSSNVKWGADRWYGILGHDANGYYAYLPAIFVFQDLNFGFYDTDLKDFRDQSPSPNYDYRTSFNGKKVNKYYVGTSIAQLPFFLIAHTYSKITGLESNGYTKLYYILINLASVFYALLGLWFLNKILILIGLSKTYRALSILTLYFGTNLFYYTFYEPGMSHVYSFGFITMFIYYGKKYFEDPKFSTLVVIAALLGIITLIRPVNIVVLLLIPYLAGSLKMFKEGFIFLFKPFPVKVLITLAIFISIISVQLIIYKIQTGSFIVYSYSQEGFNFLDPHMIDILFNYKKGLFLYTPLCLLCISGLYFLFATNRFAAYSFAGFFIVLTYLLSSWWNWWYGGSFSSRVYVEFLSIFGILLGLLFKHFKNSRALPVFLVVLVFLILFNQKQTYLYRTAKIHWEEMDKEKYWKTFFQLR